MNINRRKYLNTTVSGRSMVEMLGVLAIIGVLSIGALNGFRYAMDKTKVNTILYDVSLGFSTMQTLEYAGDDVDLGFTPESGLTMEGYRDDAGYDYVEVTAVPKSVCEKLLDFKGVGNIEGIYDANLTDLAECSEPQTMMFKNNDISGERDDEPEVCETVTHSDRNANGCCVETTQESCPSNPVTPRTCTATCSTCTTSGECCTNGTDNNGDCCAALETADCTTTTDATTGCLICQVDYSGVSCTSNDHCGGNGNGTYFCAFDNPTGDCDDAKGEGKCALVSRYSYDETTDGDWRLSSSEVNWWNAQNWCYAQSGFRPATSSDIECSWDCSSSTIVYNEGSVFAQNGGAFTSSGEYSWLEDFSCDGRYVCLYDGAISFYSKDYNDGRALCVRR